MSTSQIRNKGNLVILSLLDEKHVDFFKELQIYWEKYFKIEDIFDKPENISNYTNKKIGILFLDAAHYEKFNLDYYRIWKEKFPQFLYVVVADKPTKNDINIYKALADQILYLSNPKEQITWNSVAIIRRFWDTYSRPSTIIYKELIADFVLREISLNQKLLDLSLKEYEVLKIFIEHRGEYLDKDFVFKKVWKTKDGDVSRVLDQKISALRRKIGEKYFVTSRTKGVKFE